MKQQITIQPSTSVQLVDIELPLTVTITSVPPTGNKPPVVGAGVDQNITSPANKVFLTGTATDADDTIASVKWSQQSGPTVATLATPNATSTDVSSLVVGSYVFGFEAKDTRGASAIDYVTVVVKPAIVVNKPPVVNAGVDQTIKLPVSEATLTGVTSDPDGTVVAHDWKKVNGPTGEVITTPTAKVTKVTGLKEGTYTFSLQVTDNDGAITSDFIGLKVDPATPQPTTGYLALPLSAKLLISGQSNVVIENLQFKNMADIAIRVGNSTNVIIRNCFFNGSGAEAIEIENANNVTITNCLFARMTCGVYALDSNTIKVNNNQAVNFRQRVINGDTAGRGQFVQFNSVGGAGNEIIGNRTENFPGESNAEDVISLYNSSGTQSSPIIVRDNWIRGGGPKDLGSDSSGGGIMSGDSGGSWQLVENNKLLNPGNYIVAIAGGSNITVRNNQGYQELKPWSNIGGYAYGGQQGAQCTNATFTGNNLWANSPDYGLNHYYFGSGGEVCTNSNISNNISTITPSQLNFPVHLITFVTPAELLTIRK